MYDRGAVVYGWAAPPGREPGVDPQDGVPLYRSRGVAVYRRGESPDLRRTTSKGTFGLIYGRIYDRSGNDPAAFDPRAAEGSFVHLHSPGDGTLELSTDMFGFRRLLYSLHDGVCYFATRLDGLLLPGGTRRLDGNALLHFYCFGFTPGDRTLIEGVRKLPARSRLRWDGSGLSVQSSGSVGALFPPADVSGKNEDDLCRTLDGLLLETVRTRVGKGGRTALALSGGVDSGYLALQLNRAGIRPPAYHIAYGDRYSEAGRIRRLAELLDFDLRELVLSGREVLENYFGANAVGSEPVGCNNATMGLLAAHASRDGVDTLLDGDGADRLFLGMERQRQMRRALAAFRLLQAAGLAGAAAAVLSLLPWKEGRKTAYHFRNWRSGRGPYMERKIDPLAPYAEEFEKTLYGLAVEQVRDAFLADFPGCEKEAELFWTYQGIVMCPEMFFHDPGELQSALNICSVPGYWSGSIVSFALGLPARYKIAGGTTKYILRRAAGRLIDPAYFMLPKVGLQSAMDFACATPQGSAWREEALARIRKMNAYEMLAGMLPGGRVERRRLLGLRTWLDGNGAARRLLGEG